MTAGHSLRAEYCVAAFNAVVLFLFTTPVRALCADWCGREDFASCGDLECCSCRFEEGLSCPESACPPLTPPTTAGMLLGDMEQLRAALLSRQPGEGAALSIAVVGSSGNVLYHRYGASIDAKSIVMRVNQAMTDTYEDDVGHWYPQRRAGLVRVGWKEGLSNAVSLESASHELCTEAASCKY